MTTKLKNQYRTGWIVIVTMAIITVVSVSCSNKKGEATLTGRIDIDASVIQGSVNPLVFGNNIQAANSKFIFDEESKNVAHGINGDGVWNPKINAPEPKTLQMVKDLGIKIMRYPGGCLVHNFDWKKTVGPVENRPDFTFGIDEFIEYCQALGSEPLINVALYVGDAKDKADLVEYLNAPATSEYPWAMKRAEWGHKEPFKVKYFEMGNEEDHGNHNVKPYQRVTADRYGDWFVECAKLMKEVDSSIKMGALMGTGTGPFDLWNKIVLSKVKKEVDFICIHTYAVGADYISDISDNLLRACMASGDDLEEKLSLYRRVIHKNAGRDIPIALTEYNAGFPHTEPSPYAAALFSADYLRVLLKPQHNVLMANYWRLSGYWGLMLETRENSGLEKGTMVWKKMAGYYLYRLWAQHFGNQLVETKVIAPKLEFEGSVRTSPRRKNLRDDFNDNPGVTLTDGRIDGAHATVTGETIKLELKGYTGSNNLELGSLDASPSALYRCAFKARFKGNCGSYRFGVNIEDNRGWSTTRHLVPVASIESAKEWMEFTANIMTLPDCSGLTMNWWLNGQSAVPVNATIEVKDIKFERLPPKPPYPVLTATASLSQDGKSLYIIVFNKHSEKDIETDVKIDHASIVSNRVWQVNGPNLSAHNGDGELVKEVLSGEAVPCFDDGFTYTFPAHSMTAFDLKLE